MPYPTEAHNLNGVLALFLQQHIAIILVLLHIKYIHAFYSEL